MSPHVCKSKYFDDQQKKSTVKLSPLGATGFRSHETNDNKTAKTNRKPITQI